MFNFGQVDAKYVRSNGKLSQNELEIKSTDLGRFQYKKNNMIESIQKIIDNGCENGTIKSFNKNEVLDATNDLPKMTINPDGSNSGQISYKLSQILGALTEHDVNRNALEIFNYNKFTDRMTFKFNNNSVLARITNKGNSYSFNSKGETVYQFDGAVSTFDPLLNETSTIGALFEQFQPSNGKMFNTSESCVHEFYPTERILMPYYDIMKGVSSAADKYDTSGKTLMAKKRDRGFVEVTTVGFEDGLSWTQRERMFERDIRANSFDANAWALNRTMNLPLLMLRQSNAYELYTTRAIFDNQFTYKPTGNVNPYYMPTGIPSGNIFTASQFIGSPLMTFNTNANGQAILNTTGSGNPILCLVDILVYALQKYRGYKVKLNMSTLTLQALALNSNWDLTKFGSGLVASANILGDKYVSAMLAHFGGSKGLTEENCQIEIMDGMYYPDENDPFGRPEASLANNRTPYYFMDAGKVILTIEAQSATKTPLIHIAHTPIIQNGGYMQQGVPAASPVYMQIDTMASNTFEGVTNPILYDYIKFNMGMIIPVPELIATIDFTR